MYKLKDNVADFTVVDGKFAKRTYRAGETYEEIPPEEKNKFDRIEQSAKSKEQKDTAPSAPELMPGNGGKKK